MKIFAVGGYDEIGKNMTCIQVGDEALILDIGMHVEKLMGKDYDPSRMTKKELLLIDALPNDRVIDHIKKNVVGIVIGHGHLDHVGAVAKISPNYKVPIILTPFSAEILREQLQDEKRYTLEREIVTLLPGGNVSLGRNFRIELIPAAHSIPDATIVAIHTPEGTIVYAVDFKFDENPILGHKTDVSRLRQLGSEGVKALFFDTTRIDRNEPTGSEADAREKIIRAFAEMRGCGGIIATTFASHIARMKTLIEMGEKSGRQVLILGRSMEKYCGCATRLKLLDIKDAKIFGYSKGVQKIMNKLRKKDKEKYMMIVTGNQGEPNSILERISRRSLPYPFSKGDVVMFCCEVIPSPVNIECRKILETRLLSQGASLYKGLHVSGHASKPNLRELLKMVNPEHVIPTHGGTKRLNTAKALALEEGFNRIHIMHDGQRIEI